MNKEGNKVKYPYNQFSTKVEEFDFRNIIRRIRLVLNLSRNTDT